MEPQGANRPWRRKALLVLSSLFLAIGNCAGPLVLRLYFVRGGKRIWLSSWIQTSGWPIMFIPLAIAYFTRRKAQGPKAKLILMNLRVFIATAAIGVLLGLSNYMYAYGVARLPVSTSTLLVTSQLAFTALFAFVLVKQKFSPYSINAIVLVSMGSGVLGLHSSSDRPEGEPNKLYVLGFVMTILAAASGGLILPLVELMYLKAKQVITYTLVLEVQCVLCVFATVFCTVGMLVSNDFQVIPREAREFELGETRYYVVIVCSGIIWQFFFLGIIGVIFCASSLLSGIIITLLLPVTEILAVFFFHEKFQAEKGVSLVLSLWGFGSYFYGEIKHKKKAENQPQEKNQSQGAEDITLAVAP